MFNKTGTESASIDAVRLQFDQWRSRRTKREPIPQHLWEAAVNLCKTHPITHVCRHLHLSFADLKKRLPTAKPSVRFMEFDLNSFAGGWRLECDRTDGTRLRLSADGQPPAIDDVLRWFLS